MSALTAISAIFTALCLRSSARDPPPIGRLLKTKAQPQFERPVERLSTPLFRAFQPSNPVQFGPLFFVFTVRSAEGRNAPLPPPPMSTQFDPRSPKVTQGHPTMACSFRVVAGTRPKVLGLFYQIPRANYQEPLLLAASFVKHS
jgi:hypothetical protein